MKTGVRFKKEKADQLRKLVEDNKTQRLAPEAEGQAIALLKEAFCGGKAGISLGMEIVLAFPWSIGVKALEEVWPELKPASHKQILDGLESEGYRSEQGKRFRLSLARALMSKNTEVAMQIASAACREMIDLDKGEMSPQDRYTFFNVFVGKGKPWLVQIPAGNENLIEPVLFCALHVSFSLRISPVNQLAVLRWVHGFKKLDQFPAQIQAAVEKSVKRWDSRLKKKLAAEVPGLPFQLELESGKSKKLELLNTVEQKPQRSSTERLSKPVENKKDKQSVFDFRKSWEEMGQYVKLLETDLQNAKAELRQKADDRSGKRVQRKQTVHPQTNFDLEDLTRQNSQLESIVQELREQLEDLTADHEDKAMSMEAHQSELDQFKALLGIKLKRQYAEFQGLKDQATNHVVRQHFGQVLEGVFDELKKHGVEICAGD